MYEELVKALRGCVLSKPCNGCPYYDPNGPTEKCATMNIAAADAIEELQATLCNWCAVCPEDKRDLSTCEIYESCRAKPPKEE